MGYVTGLLCLVIKKDEPQRHEGRKECTKTTNDHFHAVCSTIDYLMDNAYLGRMTQFQYEQKYYGEKCYHSEVDLVLVALTR